jgi:MFS family permease
MLLYFTMMGSSVLMPLYVQTVMGRSAVVSGLVTLPGSLATALISPVAGKIYDKMGIRKIFIPGSILLLISSLGMSFITLDTPLAVASALNVLRNVSIGGLMMPLLTWGTGNVAKNRVADASSLLTSFRTIAGSIGSAVFVGIMTFVAASSAERLGNSALMHGMNMAFAAMALSALVLALFAIFGTKAEEAR